MSAYFSLTSNAPGAAELVVVDGPPYSPFVLVGKDIGSPGWQHQFSGARGTRGRRVASGTPDDRRATFGLLAEDQADKDELAATLSSITSVVDEMRRFGGLVTFREHAQTYRQHLEVLVGEISIADWGSQEFNLRDAARPALTFTCGPYTLGDPIDFGDAFEADSLTAGDYIAEAGALANLSVTGGALAGVANLATENRLIHVAQGYAMGDHEVTAKITPGATITGFKAGVVVKSWDATHRIEMTVDDDGTNSKLRINMYNGGAPGGYVINLGARVSNGTPFWIRGRVVGNRVDAYYFTADPESLGPEAVGETVSGVTTGRDLGRGFRGRAGIVFLPQHAGARLDDLTVRAYLGVPSTGMANKVPVFRHEGPVPGDAPALADVEVRCSSGSSIASLFGLFAWWRRPLPHNLVQDGDFETGTSRWSAASVTGFSGAATSITRTPSALARYGANVGIVVTPATANVGAKLRIAGQFLAGETYTARAWVRAPSGTTPVALRVGAPLGPDTAVGTATALSSTWQELTVTWTPTADKATVYVGVEQTAATATTFHIDGVQFYQGTEAPTAGHARGSGARPPFGIVEAEDYVAVSGFTETASSSYSGAVTLDATPGGGGATYWAEWMVDPALQVPDDYAADTVSFVVFAKIRMASVFTGGVRGYLTARTSDDAQPIYPAEYGSVGSLLARPASSGGMRYARLGTMTLPVARVSRPRWTLRATFIVAAGTNGSNILLDYLALVPARGHVCSPTAKAATGYPAFLPGSGLRSRVIYSDGSSERSVAAGAPGSASGFNGVIEVPPGQLESMVITSPVIPDDPAGTTHTIAGEEVPHVRIAVRPRWSFLREAP